MKKTYVVGLGLIGIAVLVGLQVGCHRESGSDVELNILAGNPHRVVTISSVSSGSSNPCEVDYPVTFVRIGKHHTIAWEAADYDFWIKFDPAKPSPINADNIKVKQGNRTNDFPITIDASKAGYFMYAIFDHDPTANPNNPCKSATEDHDTGLNVKP